MSKLVFIIPSTLYWGKAALHCRCAERLGERERERGREREDQQYQVMVCIYRPPGKVVTGLWAAAKPTVPFSTHTQRPAKRT